MWILQMYLFSLKNRGSLDQIQENPETVSKLCHSFPTQENDVCHTNIPFPVRFPCVMGSAGCGHSLCKGCRTMPTLDYISAICFAQAPGACRKRRNDNFILKKIFANAICSLYMKSNEQNGRSCLLKEPCRATLFCFPTEVRMQSAFVPVVKTLELSGASKREQVGLKKMHACLTVPGMHCWLPGLRER